jgi:predicted acyltransferase
MDKLQTAFSNRLQSLDMFRGFVIASMILINNPGSWDYIFLPFRHANWHGWTFADLVFPFFLCQLLVFYKSYFCSRFWCWDIRACWQFSLVY